MVNFIFWWLRALYPSPSNVPSENTISPICQAIDSFYIADSVYTAQVIDSFDCEPWQDTCYQLVAGYFPDSVLLVEDESEGEVVLIFRYCIIYARGDVFFYNYEKGRLISDPTNLSRDALKRLNTYKSNTQSDKFCYCSYFVVEIINRPKTKIHIYIIIMINNYNGLLCQK